jgi:hypothetical protein
LLVLVLVLVLELELELERVTEVLSHQMTAVAPARHLDWWARRG